MAASVDQHWQRWSGWLEDWFPYLTLTVATVLSLLLEQPWSERVGTVVLAGLTAVWIYFMYPRAAPLHYRVRMLIYFAGMLAFGTVMMLRQPIFFAFVTSGFFQASKLRPRALAFAGVAVTSILINTLISGFPWPNLATWLIFLTIIALQTFAIGYGTILGERMNELSEERRLAVARLEVALEENAGLHAQLLVQAREAGVLDERQRLAREVHDTVAQGLTGIITQLQALEQAHENSADWQRHLNNAVQLARESLTEARRLVQSGRPQILEEAGLPQALAQIIQEWSQINNVKAEFKITGEPVALHPEVEVALLRTAQEALSNVARHARAGQVEVTLAYLNETVTLDIIDDGAGFEMPQVRTDSTAGFGLSTMRQRISRVAGRLAIESAPGEGTAVSASVPALMAQQEAAKL